MGLVGFWGSEYLEQGFGDTLLSCIGTMFHNLNIPKHLARPKIHASCESCSLRACPCNVELEGGVSDGFVALRRKISPFSEFRPRRQQP